MLGRRLVGWCMGWNILWCQLELLPGRWDVSLRRYWNVNDLAFSGVWLTKLLIILSIVHILFIVVFVFRAPLVGCFHFSIRCRVLK